MVQELYLLDHACLLFCCLERQLGRSSIYLHVELLHGIDLAKVATYLLRTTLRASVRAAFKFSQRNRRKGDLIRMLQELVLSATTVG